VSRASKDDMALIEAIRKLKAQGKTATAVAITELVGRSAKAIRNAMLRLSRMGYVVVPPRGSKQGYEVYQDCPRARSRFDPMADVNRKIGKSVGEETRKGGGNERPKSEKIKPKTRACLKCQRAFRSTHVGNRLCTNCKNSPNVGLADSIYGGL